VSKRTEVAVIGAGPYGLSIAAQLGALQVDHRIFGEPMQFWKTHMPRGMSLKSDGFASNLADADGALSLKQFCAENGSSYADEGLPVALETFVAYGEAFQRRMVPQLEKTRVSHLAASGDGFALSLANGETLEARRVVVAVGISDYPYLPPQFAGLPPELVSHSAQHRDPAAFAGRDVSLVGGGSSAVDLAVLLREHGARVRLIARGPQIKFNLRTPLLQRPLWQQLAHPHTGIGPGWKAYFYTEYPNLFRHLPAERRKHIVRTTCGPAGGWFMRERFDGQIAVTAATSVESAAAAGGRLQLDLADAHGGRSQQFTDHLIVCTGYRVDLRRLQFVDPALLGRIREIDHSPALGAAFESSVRGLHFVGTASALSYGPMMRFVVGATWTARALSRHLAAAEARQPAVMYSPSRAA
jgi:FAD-dependent urate hydroxylase